MFGRILSLVRTEPAVVTGAVQAVLALVVGLGFTLSAGQEGAILGVTTAVLGAVTAFATRPFQVSALTGLASAIVTFLLAFGVKNISPGVVPAVNALIAAVVPLVVSLRVTPLATVRAEAREAAKKM